MKAKKLLLQITICILALFLCFEQFPTYLDRTLYNSTPTILIESKGEMSAGQAAAYVISKAEGKFGIFAGSSDDDSDFENSLIIRTSSETEKLLRDKYHIYPGIYRSVTQESTSVKYGRLSEYSSESSLLTLGFSSDYDGLQAFVTQITSELSKEDILITYNPGNSGMNPVVKNVIIVWSMATIMLFALSLFDAALEKKESTVKIVNGGSAKQIVLKEILLNVVGINVSALLVFLALKIFYGGYPLINVTVPVVVIGSIISSLPYLSLLMVNIREDLSAYKGAGLITTFSYSVKVLATFVSLALLFLTMTSISETYTFIKNTYVYDNLKTTTFIRIVTEEWMLAADDFLAGMERSRDIQNDIYVKYYDSANPVLLSETFDDESRLVFANTNAKKYLEKEFTEINSCKSKIIAFIPENTSKLRFSDVPFVDFLEEELNFKIERVVYTNTRSAPLLNCRFESDNLTKKNPVLIYFNLTPQEWKTILEKDNSFLTPCYEDISFSLDKNDIKSIEQDYDLKSKEVSCTDFSNQYATQKNNANLTAIACSVMLILTLLFVFQVNKALMATKFAVYGKELSIKRVNGKSNLQLYYKTCAVELLLFAFSLVAVLLIFYKVEIIIPVSFKIVGSLVIFVIMTASFIIELRRTCIKNASKMIKGGML